MPITSHPMQPSYHFMAGVHIIKGDIEARNVRNVLLVELERNTALPQIISECGSSGDTSNIYVECLESGLRMLEASR